MPVPHRPILMPEIRRPCVLSTMAGRVAARRAFMARLVSSVRSPTGRCEDHGMSRVSCGWLASTGSPVKSAVSTALT